MIVGKIQIAGFNYGIGEGKNQAGTDIKVIGISPHNTPLGIELVFTKEEFAAFIATCNETGIVAATEIPSNLVKLS